MRVTLRSCPPSLCDLRHECQRAREHRDNVTGEQYPSAPYTTAVRVLHTDGRRAEVREQACGHFIQWRQQ